MFLLNEAEYPVCNLLNTIEKHNPLILDFYLKIRFSIFKVSGGAFAYYPPQYPQQQYRQN